MAMLARCMRRGGYQEGEALKGGRRRKVPRREASMVFVCGCDADKIVGPKRVSTSKKDVIRERGR